MRRLTATVGGTRLGGRLAEERGAIAVFVALAMTVLLAFAALAIDTASVRRDAQVLRNAADAAALAIALECARPDPAAPALTPSDEKAARQRVGASSCPEPADVTDQVATMVAENGGGSDHGHGLSEENRTVTVTTTAIPDSTIMETLGFTPDPVTVSATAVWAPATNAYPAAHPLALSYCRWLDLPEQTVTTASDGVVLLLPPRQEITPGDWTGNDTCTGPGDVSITVPKSVMTPTDDGAECGTTSAKGRDVTGETFEPVTFDKRVCVASGQFGAPDGWEHGGYEIVLPIYAERSGDQYRVWDHMGFHVMGVTDRGGVWGFSTGLADPARATEVPSDVRLVESP
ncbi:hypothetical protein GB931_06530 [Modestobacter sp. I12A-02628]|uniref:Putative Flp pilus-assembly TadG-like N-terminal domain-containing protein n=1 Tax=Goekera deserti TaxID=2497753 RepID=A0A7K3WAR9_9ACTN|nr:pilus assembly protein TadG-related protein [Goekera deserti]MPQ97579.1 hypothetical protein [Goekera deserti]NDI47817.1 hypothetical protein [Goekera deserti]NEL53565.1 hypothetical protein [Goekera deserti]